MRNINLPRMSKNLISRYIGCETANWKDFRGYAAARALSSQHLELIEFA